jgi:DHA1 family multidrug/chloramphenicol efflux transport protein-like MFS transporter
MFRFFPFFLVLYEFSVYVANDMIMPGMPAVAREFQAPISMVPNSLSLYLLGGSALQIFLGPFSDRYGRRPTLLVGCLAFLLCSLALIFSYSGNNFLLLRFFQGMGLCFIGVVGYATLQEMYDEKKAVGLMSLMTSVALLAPLLGPVLGGLIIEYYHWRTVFYLIVVLAALAYVGLSLTMPETAHRYLEGNAPLSKRVDLSKLPSLNIKSVLAKYRALIANRRYLCGAITITLGQVPMLCWIGLSPVIVCEKYGLSSLYYGLLQVPFFGMLILGNILVSRLIKKASLSYLITLGSCIAGISLVLACLSSCFFGPIPTFVIFIFNGLGVGMVGAPLARSTLFATKVQKGTASAFLSLLTNIGISLGVGLTPFIYATSDERCLGLFFVGVFIFSLPFLVLHLKERDTPQQFITPPV